MNIAVTSPKSKFDIGTRVKITRDGKEVLGTIDEIVLFHRENKIGYRVVDSKNWTWYYTEESEIKKA